MDRGEGHLGQQGGQQLSPEIEHEQSFEVEFEVKISQGRKSQTTQNRFSDHPLVQMPKPDPRDNSLPGGDGKPVCSLEKKTSALKLSSCCNSTQSCLILTRQQPDINPVLTVFTNSL